MQRRHGRLTAQRVQVRAGESVRHVGQMDDVDILGQRHPARIDFEDLASRALAFGMPMAISRSKRPGRRNAGSMLFGRLVAAMTMTSPRLFRPSISDSNCATTRFSTSPSTFPLRRQRIDFVEKDDRRALASARHRRSCAGLASLSP